MNWWLIRVWRSWWCWCWSVIASCEKQYRFSKRRPGAAKRKRSRDAHGAIWISAFCCVKTIVCFYLRRIHVRKCIFPCVFWSFCFVYRVQEGKGKSWTRCWKVSKQKWLMYMNSKNIVWWWWYVGYFFFLIFRIKCYGDNLFFFRYCFFQRGWQVLLIPKFRRKESRLVISKTWVPCRHIRAGIAYL